MTDAPMREYYDAAWHGENPYDDKEVVRLERAAALIREDADARRLSRPLVLDIGCGIGPLRRWLPADRFEIAGLEWSEDAARVSRGHYDRCLVGSVEARWPFDDAVADAIHAGAILEHVFDWHAPLNEANRVLRDGSRLVVSVPNLRYWKEIKRLIRGKQPHWMSEMLHIHAYTPRFLQNLLILHGFAIDVVEADRVNFPLLPKNALWVKRRFAGFGSVLIVAAKKVRRVQVEDRSRAARYPKSKDVGMRSIEVLDPS